MLLSKKLFPQSNKTGFSLAELAIVLTIISIIIAAVISINHGIVKAKFTRAQSLTSSSPVYDTKDLAMWLETTMEQSFDEDDAGTSVNIWYDLSPEKNNASAGNAPTYMEGIANGLPVIRFDSGSNQYLSFDGSNLVNSNYTIFAVTTRNSTQAINPILGGTSTSNFNNLHFSYFTGPVFRASHYGENVASTDYIDYNISAYTAPIFQIHTLTFNSAIGKEYFENGSSVESVTSSNAKTPLASWNGAAIGRFLMSNYFNGDIAEIIIFTRHLNSNERGRIEKYLSKKWGIEI